MKYRKLLLVLSVGLLLGCQPAQGLAGTNPSPTISQPVTMTAGATAPGPKVLPNTETPAPPPAATVTGTEVPPGTQTPVLLATTAVPLATYMVPDNDNALRIFSDGGGWLWTAFSNNRTGLFHTNDGGQSWKDVLPAKFAEMGAVVSFLDSQHAWIFSETFFQRTTDGGETWQPPLEANGLGSMVGSFPSLKFSNASHGWAEYQDFGAGHMDVFIKLTQDGGETWTVVPILAQYPDEQIFTSGLHLATLCNDVFYFSNQRQIILRGSTADCTQSVSNYTGGPRNAFAIDLSTDLGKSWNEIALALPDQHPLDPGILPGKPVFFDEQNAILPVWMSDLSSQNSAYNFSDLAIYHTDNGGSHWQPNQVVLKHVSGGSLQVLSKQIFIAKCEGGFCITQDSAQTWQKIAFTEGAAGPFSFVSPQVGLVLARGRIQGTDLDQILLLRTADGGAIWRQVTVTVPGP